MEPVFVLCTLATREMKKLRHLAGQVSLFSFILSGHRGVRKNTNHAG